MSNTVWRLAKSLVVRGYLACIAPLRQFLRVLFQSPRIVVLVYHRVNDDLKDGVTVGISQFEKQIGCLARNYHVVSLEQIARGEVTYRGPKPIVAVTFDDGYLDNYTNALPILLRHQVHATFFVTTGLVDSTAAFEHDLRRLGYALPTMSWDQLREMQNLGFSIGSHTVTHINCGQSSPDVVKRELEQSLQMLRDRLSPTSPIYFAFPYGKESDISPIARQIVKEVGYDGCVSAYGGANSPPVDPYDIRRVGVDNKFDLLSFRAQIEGYKLGWWQIS